MYSNGGYHNAQAAPAIDVAAFAQADLCQLAQRLTDHLFQNPLTGRLVGYASLAVLATLASQALFVGAHDPPPNLRALTNEIRDMPQ